MRARIEERKPEKVRFTTLFVGDWFGEDGDIYVKVSPGEALRFEQPDSNANCCITNFNPDDMVIPQEVVISY